MDTTPAEDRHPPYKYHHKAWYVIGDAIVCWILAWMYLIEALYCILTLGIGRTGWMSWPFNGWWLKFETGARKGLKAKYKL